MEFSFFKQKKHPQFQSLNNLSNLSLKFPNKLKANKKQINKKLNRRKASKWIQIK